jgi:hypothetical protein
VIVGIHQPAYLPWLGYFERIRAVDLFIYLDTVQFQKGSFQNRNRVLTRDGPVWLTVPVETRGKLYSTTLKDLRIARGGRWQSKHVSTLRMSYSGAPRFSEVFPRLEPFYRRSWSGLSELCWEMLAEFDRMLGIDTPIVKASDVPGAQGRKSDLILSLCRAVGATSYLSGSQGRGYLDTDSFSAAGIGVEFQDYVPEPYPQQAPQFVPALGIVDYLFNVADPEPATAG